MSSDGYEYEMEVVFNGHHYSVLRIDPHAEKHFEEGMLLDRSKILNFVFITINGGWYLPQYEDPLEGMANYAFEIWHAKEARGYSLYIATFVDDDKRLYVLGCHPDRRIKDEQGSKKNKSQKNRLIHKGR